MRRIGRSSDKKEKTIVIDVLSIVSVLIIVLMSVLLLFGIFDFVKQYMKVAKFELSGIGIYEASELAGAAGIKKGDRLYGIDIEEAKEQILSRYIYIESVEIKRVFPNKVRFVIESRTPSWYLEISGDYYILDSSLRVLEQTKNIDMIRNAGITRLSIPSPNNVIEGEIITFGNSDGEREQTERIMNAVLLSQIKPRLTSLDIENRFDIHLEIDGKFQADIGRYENIEVKLKTIYKTLEDQESEARKAIGGSISITSSGDECAIRFRYSDGSDLSSDGASG